MKKFKKIFLVLLILLGTLFMFTACDDRNVDTPGDGSAEQDVSPWFP